MNKFRHKVRVNVKDPSGEKQKVVTGTTLRLPARLLRLLFGDLEEVMIISPGKTVESVEVKEIGGERDGRNV